MDKVYVEGREGAAQQGVNYAEVEKQANVCQRELTPKEYLARIVAQCEVELENFRALVKALPDEMDWRAAKALRGLLYSRFPGGGAL
jgi:hypothetical protein